MDYSTTVHKEGLTDKSHDKLYSRLQSAVCTVHRQTRQPRGRESDCDLRTRYLQLYSCTKMFQRVEWFAKRRVRQRARCRALVVRKPRRSEDGGGFTHKQDPLGILEASYSCRRVPHVATHEERVDYRAARVAVAVLSHTTAGAPNQRVVHAIVQEPIGRGTRTCPVSTCE